jgi:hypothetical protein
VINEEEWDKRKQAAKTRKLVVNFEDKRAKEAEVTRIMDLSKILINASEVRSRAFQIFRQRNLCKLIRNMNRIGESQINGIWSKM